MHALAQDIKSDYIDFLIESICAVYPADYSKLVKQSGLTRLLLSTSCDFRV